MQRAILRLFNAVLTDTQSSGSHRLDVTERSLRHGYILDPSINPDDFLLNNIENIVGRSGIKANSAFHKSWDIVRNTSMEQLVGQQIIHYLTTYGFESLGIYKKESVFIPHEVLELPAINEDLPLTVIKAINLRDLEKAIVELGSGVALSPETLKDIVTVVKTCELDQSLIGRIGNRELKVLLYDHFGVVPQDPTEYLRYLVANITGESLLIKNEQLIQKIRAGNGKNLDPLLLQAPQGLASIFYRYKPLFLAFRSISTNKTFFNKLRKQAPVEHVPLSQDYMNSVTSQIKLGVLDLDQLNSFLGTTSVFRKIRLAYALNFRLQAGASIVYRVRNGRGFATTHNWPASLAGSTQAALESVLDSIAKDLRRNVEGRHIYIPAGVSYAIPATEKQFTGNFPTGSSIAAPDNLIVGIHWTNTRKRVDLDLSVIGESGKTGWDASYRSKDKEVLFSGDVTDAPSPHGATELFYLGTSPREAKILMLNYYNRASGDEVEAKLLVANEKPNQFGKNYMVNPNNILATATISVSSKQNVLGLVSNQRDGNRVYFANVSIGNSISARKNSYSSDARNYLVQNCINSLDLGEILTRAGARVTNKEINDKCINLSPERLTKTSFIDLFQ